MPLNGIRRMRANARAIGSTIKSNLKGAKASRLAKKIPATRKAYEKAGEYRRAESERFSKLQGYKVSLPVGLGEYSAKAKYERTKKRARKFLKG